MTITVATLQETLFYSQPTIAKASHYLEQVNK